MKAYIVRLEFIDLQPPVWRQIVLPYGATFHRLHETIQVVTNFTSAYGYARHLHAFDLPQDHLLVTNASADDLIDGPTSSSLQVRNSARIKIDLYLERDNQLHYTYDFGDDWRLLIRLEKIVNDYHFGYPTLLDGAGEAPPEDVGGPEGFSDFLDHYFNMSHPGHAAAISFAQAQHFHIYDPSWLNYCLKNVKWQKTEWDKIDHENYEIKRDPYRGQWSQPSGHIDS